MLLTIALALLFALGSAADAYTSRRYIRLGLREINPLWRDRNGGFRFAANLALSAFVLLSFVALCFTPLRGSAYVALGIGGAGRLLLAFWNRRLGLRLRARLSRPRPFPIDGAGTTDRAERKERRAA